MCSGVLGLYVPSCVCTCVLGATVFAGDLHGHNLLRDAEPAMQDLVFSDVHAAWTAIPAPLLGCAVALDRNVPAVLLGTGCRYQSVPLVERLTELRVGNAERLLQSKPHMLASQWVKLFRPLHADQQATCRLRVELFDAHGYRLLNEFKQVVATPHWSKITLDIPSKRFPPVRRAP